MALKPNRWKNSNVPNQQMAIVCLFARWKVGMMIRNPSAKIKQQVDVPSGTSVGNYLKKKTPLMFEKHQKPFWSPHGDIASKKDAEVDLAPNGFISFRSKRQGVFYRPLRPMTSMVWVGVVRPFSTSLGGEKRRLKSRTTRHHSLSQTKKPGHHICHEKIGIIL